MDFDFRIRLLEKELAHYREMQDLVRARLDTHDHGIEALVDAQIRLTKSQERTDETVKTLAEDLKILADTVGVLAQTVTGFINALRASSNGKPTA